MDTAAVIVIICITIPAFIAITVCAVVYHSYRKKHRVYRRRISLSPVSRYSSERISADDTSRTEHYPWQRHLRESPPVFEQPSPAYDTHSLPQTRRQSRIHLSPIQTIPIRINHHQGSSNPVSPSLHTMSPPSYTELFLTPRTLTNRSETSVAHSALS